jgi:hypothetical protein
MFRFLKKYFFKSFLTGMSQEGANLESLLPEKYQEEINLPVDRIMNNFDSSKPSLVIIDDSIMILSLVEEYLEILGVTPENHNILKFYGFYAPFVLIETLKELKTNFGLKKINYAIIDIVLPGKLKKQNNYVKLDGIDVAIHLHKEYDCKNIVFFSGNVLNVYVDYIMEKIQKFRDYFKKYLNDYIIIKTSEDSYILEQFKNILSEKNNV